MGRRCGSGTRSPAARWKRRSPAPAAGEQRLPQGADVGGGGVDPAVTAAHDRQVEHVRSRLPICAASELIASAQAGMPGHYRHGIAVTRPGGRLWVGAAGYTGGTLVVADRI